MTIPKGVKSIGFAAFATCINMNNITVEDGNTVYDSRNNCNAIIETATNTLIAGCKNTVIPDNVTTIHAAAFAACANLISLTIPNSVTTILDYAFSDCISLPSVAIPSSVTSIGYGVFANCISLNSLTVEEGNTVYDSRNDCNAIIETASNTLISGCKNTFIPNGVTSIAREAFSGCNGLSSLTIPNSVNNISDDALRNCSALTSVTIGSGVSSIGSFAFYNCEALIEIISKAQTPPICRSSVFQGIKTNMCKLYVPEGCLAAYQEAAEWKNFTLMEERKGLREKCATPTISYRNGKLKFECEMEGVKYHYGITLSSFSETEGEEVSLPASYTVTVYATKEGYDDSDIATEVIDGCGLKGDVNNDGVVTVADAVTVMDIILEGNE
jgi:hypothetical protein